MGRKTFVSIGRPLPQRTNIVITRDANFAAPGAVTAPNFEAALALAREDADKRGTDEIMVIGGSEVFAAAMPLAARLEITHVHSDTAGRREFSADRSRALARSVPQRACRRAGRRGHDEADFTVLTYERLR